MKVFFLDKNEFANKSLFFPFPILSPLSKTYNFDKMEWNISLKPYQFPSDFKENHGTGLLMLQDLAKEKGKILGDFPRGDKPYPEVFKALENTQILFPFSPSGSTLEAVVNGVVSLPIFSGAKHAGDNLPFAIAAKKAGVRLDYPLNLTNFKKIVIELTEDKERYIKTVNIFREELLPNLSSNALQYIENFIRERL